MERLQSALYEIAVDICFGDVRSQSPNDNFVVGLLVVEELLVVIAVIVVIEVVWVLNWGVTALVRFIAISAISAHIPIS